ncbi:MAG: biopolymer transporter ExbD [Opitutales bacterium]|nr:biopolymer transporter ExbD [Opitutales bacterium]
MRKQGSLVTDEAVMEDINISPMIDMVFILLIFFIVTTVFVEEPGVEVNRQYARSALQQEKNVILIAITASNDVVYGGTSVGEKGIRSVLTRLLKDAPDMPVILQVDKDSSAGTVIKVVDEAMLARAKSIKISTAKSSR